MSELPAATASERGERRTYKRRMSNFLLNKSLQLRYIGFVTVLSTVLCSALGYLIWQQSTAASQSVQQSADQAFCESIVGDCAEIRADMVDDLGEKDTFRAVTMVGIGVCLVLVLTLFLLVMTHKVAGPLYKVRKYFDQMAAGKLGEVYPLRKGDMLQDFYEKFQATHDAVRSGHQADLERFRRFLDACESAGISREGDLGAALDDLESHVESRTAALQ